MPPARAERIVRNAVRNSFGYYRPGILLHGQMELLPGEIHLTATEERFP
jgi:hypothetical protein